MRSVLIVCLLSFLFTGLHAQTTHPNTNTNKNSNVKKKGRSINTMIDLNLKAGIPMNEFQQATKSIPFGLEGALLFQPNKNLFLFPGFDIGWMSMGSRTQEVNIPVVISAGNTIIDQFNIPLKFKIANNITTAHFVLRVSSPTDEWKMYAEGVAGFNYLSTKTSVYDESPNHYLSKPDNNLIFDKKQIEDFTYSVGGGVGFMIKIGQYSNINLKGSYIWGGLEKYYDRSDIENWNISVSVPSAGSYNSTTKDLSDADLDLGSVPKVSRTDMVIINLGFIFYLD